MENTERDVWEFLEEFSDEDLIDMEVLKKRGKWGAELQAPSSIEPLLALMHKGKIAQLTAKNGWYLKSGGEYCNPKSTKGAREGNARDKDSHVNVFNSQNEHINPHYRPSKNSENTESSDPKNGGKLSSLNTILYGPPGTGKTYATAQRCVEICDGGKVDECGQDNIRDRYKKLVSEGQVEFITFHQSYGYEEFVEGLRPEIVDDASGENKSAGFRLSVTDGVLKRIAKRAREVSKLSDGSDFKGRQFFKMGLGHPNNKEDSCIFGECIESKCAMLGWGGDDIDWSEPRFDNQGEILGHWQKEVDPKAKSNDANVSCINAFRNTMKCGDIIIVPDSSGGSKYFRAIGEVIGNYKFVKRDTGDNYPHRRDVFWHWSKEDNKPGSVSELYDGKLTQRTIHLLDGNGINHGSFQSYLREVERSLPYVLVIDEINRANVSRVMGELVTLLEDDKRQGAENEVVVTLPHSAESFAMPANLHILGTMNTADRSIALLDTALRRRFEFEELPPKPELLNDAFKLTGVDLPKVLRAMNERLEYLLDRDHLLGHAWLMDAKTKEDVDRVMRHKIIPLIAEYFYDDWEKVRAVLGGGKNFVLRKELRAPPGLEDTGETRHRWTVKPGFTKDDYNHLVSGTANTDKDNQ